MSTYEQYRWLRRECGYDEEGGLHAAVWNGCDNEAQQNMLAQMRAGAAEVAAMRLSQPADWGTWGA